MASPLVVAPTGDRRTVTLEEYNRVVLENARAQRSTKDVRFVDLDEEEVGLYKVPKPRRTSVTSVCGGVAESKGDADISDLPDIARVHAAAKKTPLSFQAVDAQLPVIDLDREVGSKRRTAELVERLLNTSMEDLELAEHAQQEAAADKPSSPTSSTSTQFASPLPPGMISLQIGADGKTTVVDRNRKLGNPVDKTPEYAPEPEPDRELSVDKGVSKHSFLSAVLLSALDAASTAAHKKIELKLGVPVDICTDICTSEIKTGAQGKVYGNLAVVFNFKYPSKDPEEVLPVKLAPTTASLAASVALNAFIKHATEDASKDGAVLHVICNQLGAARKQTFRSFEDLKEAEALSAALELQVFVETWPSSGLAAKYF